MREADFAKPIPVVSTRVRHAADLRAEALKIIDQARQVDAEVNEAEEQEFLARCGDRVIRVVCDGCFGIGCTCCNDTGFNYRARFMGRGRHNPMFVERVDEIRDILLADTWRSNDGRLMNPSDFHDGHLVNTVKLIRRERFQTEEAFFFASAMQFIMPHGKQKLTECPLPIKMKPLYDRMMGSGCRFEVEMLRTGEVSATITRLETDQRDGEDIDIRITANGPAVQDGMIEMLVAKSWERVDHDMEDELVPTGQYKSEEDAGDAGGREEAGPDEGRED